MGEVPNGESLDASRLEKQLHRMLGVRPASPNPKVLRCDKWIVDFFAAPEAPGTWNFLAVADDPVTEAEFDDAAREAAIRWLHSGDAAWLEDMRRARPRLTGPVETPDLAPDPDVVEASLVRLLDVAGDLGMSIHTVVDGETVIAIDIFYFAHRMFEMRSVLMLALALQTVENPAALYRRVEDQMETAEPGLVDQLHDLVGAKAENGFALPYVFISVGMGWLLEDRLVEPKAPGLPLRFALGPVSPLLELWLVLAVSLGAVVPPYPVPGVFRCEYHLCRRVFTSHKLGVTGKYRFCSVKHGKAFYAARRMKEKSKKAQRDALAEEQ